MKEKAVAANAYMYIYRKAYNKTARGMNTRGDFVGRAKVERVWHLSADVVGRVSCVELRVVCVL